MHKMLQKAGANGQNEANHSSTTDNGATEAKSEEENK